jgi:hypothetical protein
MKATTIFTDTILIWRTGISRIKKKELHKTQILNHMNKVYDVFG